MIRRIWDHQVAGGFDNDWTVHIPDPSSETLVDYDYQPDPDGAYCSSHVDSAGCDEWIEQGTIYRDRRHHDARLRWYVSGEVGEGGIDLGVLRPDWLDYCPSGCACTLKEDPE